MEINLEMRYGLAGVENEDRPHFMGAADNRHDIRNGARGVAHMGDCDDLRAFGDDLIGGVRTDASVLGQIEPFEGCSGTVGELLERQQHRMVFCFGDHNLIAGLQSESLGRLAAAAEARIAERGRQ